MGKTKRAAILVLGFAFVLLLVTQPRAAMMEGSHQGGGFRKPALTPNSQIRVHDVGKVWLTVSNYATFANPHDLDDPRANYTGLAPSCMYPGGSNLEYLFAGFLWIGAIMEVEREGQLVIDTLVSAGGDGWLNIDSELWPDFPPNGDIELRSTRPPDVYPYGDTVGAVSEQDFIAVFTDTKTDPAYVPVDPYNQKPHVPLGIEVTQKSYAWSYEYAEDFILFDYEIVNIGQRPLENVWLGLYIDADVWHTSENPYGAEQGAQDDICGFVDSVVTGAGKMGIFTAYIADNNGQPYDGVYDFRSPRGVSGVRVVRSPNPDLQFGFNWWISNTNAALDWGPMKQENHARLPGGVLPSGGLGTPGPDWSKYFIMSNGEFDYDQIFCNLDVWTDYGWIEKSDQASDLANGYDTRYLFSFGPFAEIPVGDTLKLTTAYICGENLHVDPSNYPENLENGTADSASVAAFYNNLDFTDFATNSQWADWVYDNPGVDTDGDGYRGEFEITPEGDTFWFKGDGVPDFAGPPPPPSPRLTVRTSPGKVVLEWDGKRTESEEDIFSGEIDFEGYKIYMSRTGRLGEYTLVAVYDVVDFDSTFLDPADSVQKLWKEPPRRLEEFYQLGYPPDFDPVTDPNWVPHSWNNDISQIALGDTMYSYTIDGLSETIGLYFAVTAYDFGNPVTRLSPLESSQTINATFVYPVATGEEAVKVLVFPNPYKINVDYAGMGYEADDPASWTQFDRRIRFAGLPSSCTIRIFTLDGDLVRQIDHPGPSTETETVAYWDLISRNTQAVVSGIYIYTIEGSNGFSDIGKIAIIK